MANYELSEAADRDLTGIYIYSYREFGATQADAYLAALENCFMLLAAEPGLGRRVDHLRRGYFRFQHARHSIFYTVTGEGIRVMRVLHARMDPPRHL